MRHPTHFTVQYFEKSFMTTYTSVLSMTMKIGSFPFVLAVILRPTSTF